MKVPHPTQAIGSKKYGNKHLDINAVHPARIGDEEDICLKEKASHTLLGLYVASMIFLLRLFFPPSMKNRQVIAFIGSCGLRRQ
jgi:hypothetical protein